MDLLKIAVLLARIVLGLDTIQVGLARLLNEDVDKSVEHVPYATEKFASQAATELIRPDIGLQAIHNQIADAVAHVDTSLSGILAAIGAVGTGPVNLPTTPPTGYGGATASDVWDYLLADPYTAGNMLYHLHESHEHRRGLASYHVCANPFFFVYYPVGEGD